MWLPSIGWVPYSRIKNHCVFLFVPFTSQLKNVLSCLRLQIFEDTKGITFLSTVIKEPLPWLRPTSVNKRVRETVSETKREQDIRRKRE